MEYVAITRLAHDVYKKVGEDLLSATISAASKAANMTLKFYLDKGDITLDESIDLQYIQYAIL